MDNLYVFDLMTLHPITVTTDATLREVLSIMRDECVRQLPILDETGALSGIITDRDLRLAMNSPLILHDRWQDEALLDSMTAVACMTPAPITIAPDAPAYLAAEMLCTYKFGALPVVNDQELVGIITVSDLLEAFIHIQKRSASVVEIEVPD